MGNEFTGKRIIVTGGRKGIGRAIAEAFLAENARVAICARSEDEVRSAADELNAKWPGSALAEAVDVRDTGQVRRFVNNVAAAWGGVDILVNNAGESHSGTIDNSEPEDVLNQGNILQYGHYRLAQAVMPYMRAQHWGRIIGINAVVGHVPSPGGIGSNMNRAACIAFSKSLAMYLAPDNILVNSINLGFLESSLWDGHHERLSGSAISKQDFMQIVTDFVPLGRLGTAEDVIGTVLFLAGEKSAFITGASIDISGGLFGQLAYFPKLMQQMVTQEAP